MRKLRVAGFGVVTMVIGALVVKVCAAEMPSQQSLGWREREPFSGHDATFLERPERTVVPSHEDAKPGDAAAALEPRSAEDLHLAQYLREVLLLCVCRHARASSYL